MGGELQILESSSPVFLPRTEPIWRPLSPSLSWTYHHLSTLSLPNSPWGTSVSDHVGFELFQSADPLDVVGGGGAPSFVSLVALSWARATFLTAGWEEEDAEGAARLAMTLGVAEGREGS